MTGGALVLADADVGEELTTHLIAHHREDLAAVVTISENRISALARHKGIATFVFQGTARLLEELQRWDLQIDVGYLLWWPHIIDEQLLETATRGFFNTHPSLLPHARGKHYNFWTIVERAPFGVTIHSVSKSIDSGDIVAQAPIPYGWTDTGETLYRKAKREMINLFVETYPLLRTGRVERIPQTLSAGSFHRAAEMDAASVIDLERTYTARDFLNLLRARTFAGYPACRFLEAGCVYEVRVDIRKVSP